MAVHLITLIVEWWQITRENFTFPKRDIFDFVKPYFYATKIVFLVNFTVEHNQFQNGVVIVTRLDKIKSGVLCLVVFLLLVQQNLQVNLNVTSNLELLHVGSYLFQFFGLLLMLVMSGMMYVMRFKYIELLNKIHRIDQTLIALKFPTDINTSFKQTSVFVLLVFIYGLIGYIVCTAYLKFNFSDFILELVMAQFHVLLGAIYYTNLVVLYLRYKKLNQCFKFLFLNPQTKYRKVVATIDHYYYVHTFSSLHMDLTECTVLLNVIFSFLIMLCVGICLVFTVFTCYSTYLVWQNYEEATMNMAIKNCVIDSMLITSFFALALPSSLISKAGKETANVLHLAANFSYDEKLLKKYLGFSMQISHVHPVATCGLFMFDWTLAFSMVTAIFTNLIILIQSSFE